jgi:hypothetical protein
LEQIAAISYIAMADLDIVALKRREFIDHLRTGS